MMDKIDTETQLHDSPSRGGANHDSESRATDRHAAQVVWLCFDKEADVLVTQRDRPHWDQNGTLTFVTFRLADSMPKEVVQRWQQEQEHWIAIQGLQYVAIDDVLKRPDFPQAIRRQFLNFRK